MLSLLINILYTTFTILLFSATTLLSLPHPLISFLHSLPEPSQRLLLSWNNTLPPCLWPGVSCSGNSTITSLNLSHLGLSGQLSSSAPHLCRLTTLRDLSLSFNNLSGPIPPSLFHCPSLTTLRLAFNSLSGPIPPDVLLATRLTHLVLRGNFLSGSIPKQLFLLPKLQLLHLSSNNLTGPLPDFPSPCPISILYLHQNKLTGPLPRSLSNCGNLTEFYASENQLSGIIPDDAFLGLRHLQKLYMDDNELKGELPRSLVGLTGLLELVLSRNQFNGTIPEDIGQLQSLSLFSLWGNNLIGAIPRSVGTLELLQFLWLSDNQLSRPLPPELGNCSFLVEIELQYNLIGGPIPSEVSKLKNLKNLFLFGNRLEGSIPPEIGNMTSLIELQLYNNSLSGRIPMEVLHLRNLRYMSLAFNKLSGEVPGELGRGLSYGLVKIDLSGNDFYGPIPPYLCEGGKLTVLVIGHNRFNGSFPSSIAQCASLWRLILSNNQLHGSIIPESMTANPGISYMDLSSNLFDGHIPSVLGYWRNLSMLDISNNLLSGSIPHELGNLKKLEKLRISANRLTGYIPHELANCTKLLKLDLSNNFLSGSSPVEVVAMEKLQSLLLSGNKLSGGIPDTFTPTQSLLELQLGDNMFEGSIPSSLGKLGYIYLVLNLSSNRLNGSIPPSFSHLDKLQMLDLSNNSLTGEIPSGLNNMMALSFVNVSFNQLSGSLPDSWIKFLNSSPSSFSRNPELCIDGKYYCKKEGKEHSHRTRWVILAMVVLGILLFLVGVRTATYMAAVRIRKDSAPHQSSIRSIDSGTDLPEDLTYDDILRATEYLDEKYVIGRGRYGTVYRTEFEIGKLWAVKRVDLSESCFILEMKVMSSVKHRNLVKMAGYCMKDGFGMIIYEYMPGGTLFDILHDRKKQVALDWETRHRIALGVAQGLSYLHHDCVPQIIHRDVKSNNILMDSELEPKIGDFGTAKMISDAEASSTMSVVVGTLGYIAPENGYSTKLTEKSDVYSYGVVLLELLCRKLAVDPSFEDGVDIVTWIRSKSKNVDRCSILSLLDKEMYYWMEDEKNKALELLDLALSCTQVAFEARPSMREVVGILMKMKGRETKKKTF